MYKFSNTNDAYVVSALGELDGISTSETMLVSAGSDSEAVGSVLKLLMQSGKMTLISSWTTIKIDPETLQKIGIIKFVNPEPVIDDGRGVDPVGYPLVRTPPYAPGEG